MKITRITLKRKWVILILFELYIKQILDSNIMLFLIENWKIMDNPETVENVKRTP